jgi:MFS family permease
MILRSNIKVLALHNFFTDFRLFSPIAILFFAEVTGSFSLGMSIFAATMLSQAICELPTGIVSDHLGRKRTLILGSFFSALSVTLYALSTQYLLLLLGAVIEGLSRSFYSGNNEALLFDTLAEKQQTSKFAEYSGKLGSLFQAALAISALLGGFLTPYGFRLVVWLSVIPQILAFGVSLFAKEPKKPQNTPVTTNIFAHTRSALALFFSRKRLRLLSLSSIIGFAVGESSYQFQSAFIQTVWPTWAIGIAKAITNIGGTVSFYFAHKLINTFGELKVLLGSGIYSKASSLIGLLFPTPISPILMGSNSFLYGAETVSENTLLQKEFTSHQRATMGSLNALGGSLAFALYAPLLGALADRTNPATALIMSQLITILPLYWYYRLLGKLNSTR